MRDNFQEIDFFTPTIKLLKSYPYLGADTFINIAPVMFNQFAREGENSLGINGSSQIRQFRNVTGGIILSERLNFQLYIRRSFRDESFFLPIGMLIQNLPLWINIENAYRGTQWENPLLPRFSNFDDGIDNITSDGGTVWQQVSEVEAGQGVFDLMIQIHIDYEIFIENRRRIPD